MSFLHKHLNYLREGYTEKKLADWLSRAYGYSKKTRRIGKARIFYDPVYVVKKVAELRSFRLPIWAIITPSTPEETSHGAIYWVVESPNREDEVWLVRTTYGYAGTGPNQSAIILEFFEKLRAPIEVRSADYLLGFLGA